MKQNLLLNIFDMKAKTWGIVQTHPNFTSAERMLSQMIETGQGDLSKYPQDFSLYKVGTTDPSTGVIDALSQPELVAHVIDYVKSE